MILIALASLALAVAFAVETASWWIRAYARPDQFGLFTSRSNILLYAGRFFALIFSFAISIAIETGARPSQVSIFLGISFGFSTFVQALLFRGGGFTRAFMPLILSSIFLPITPPPEDEARPCRAADRLMAATMTSSIVFGLGLGVPLVLAAIFPVYRLTISNVGQIINAGGMIVLLLFVDQTLFRSMDRGTLIEDVRRYSAGRIFAFGSLTVIFLGAGKLLP